MIDLLKHNLKNFNKKKTLLAIGPVTKNTIIASSNIAKKKKIPLMLIASRRQIETKKLNSGYVENLTTEKYSSLITDLGKERLILCRDHGGPYQGIDEKLFKKKTAMNRAKISLKADIDSNFKILHIDTSIQPNNKILTEKTIIEDTVELIDFAFNYSKKKTKKIFFEIGTEEPSCFTGGSKQLNDLLIKIFQNLKKKKLPLPLFCVLQTGTRVKEFKNIGDLNNLNLLKKSFKKIREISKICIRNNVNLKQHNTDYLSSKVLKKMSTLGVSAANVAPEFGHVESLCLYNLLKENNLNQYSEKFLEISYNSNKWKKWLTTKSNLTDIEKALISGHYIFADKDFLNLKRKIKKDLDPKVNLDTFLISQIEKRIIFYLECFKMI